MDAYASRKFILTIVGMGASTAAFFMGKVAVMDWLLFMGAMILGYGAVNVAELWVNVIKARVEKTPLGPAA